MAAGDLTDIKTLKAWLGVTGGADDGPLGTLISAASADFLQRTNRLSLASATYTETYDGPGGSVLPLMNFPVTAVASVMVNGVTISQSPDGVASGWVFDRFGVKLVGYTFARGFQNVKVTYTAGYATTPLEVQQAVDSMCASWWKRRQWTDQASKNLGGEIVSFRKEDISPEAQKVIDQYARRIPL